MTIVLVSQESISANTTLQAAFSTSHAFRWCGPSTTEYVYRLERKPIQRGSIFLVIL